MILVLVRILAIVKINSVVMPCLWHRCFAVNFAKFLRIPFLRNTSRRLLLKVLVIQGIFTEHVENAALIETGFIMQVLLFVMICCFRQGNFHTVSLKQVLVNLQGFNETLWCTFVTLISVMFRLKTRWLINQLLKFLYCYVWIDF